MISLAKKCFTILLVAGLCLAFLPQAEAGPLREAKAVGGKVIHGVGKVLKRSAHPFKGC